MWQVSDNQEVGLEAAIFQRKRNSSLVETSRAENVTGLSLVPKLRVTNVMTFVAVGERWSNSEA